jgi:carbamoyl-phosphate synthase small subunit
MIPYFLVLDDGTSYPGKGFGSPPPKIGELSRLAYQKCPAGEVVFNTGMSGYHEILTDPSYSGQIIVMTYPHIGNYGTDENWTEYGPAAGDGEGRLKASALVVRRVYDGPLPKGRESLDSFMKRYRKAGLSDVDTRRLTLRIRSGGSPRGVIVQPSDAGDFLSQDDREKCLNFLRSYPRMEGRDLVTGLGTARVMEMNEKLSTGGSIQLGSDTTGGTGGSFRSSHRSSPHMVIVDCGVKAGILRELLALGCRVTLVPNAMTAEDLLSLKPDGVLFSNGPGDPRVLEQQIAMAKDLIGKKPLFGICLGHQILSLALGARIFKMKFGHHGVNNPVRDEDSGAVLITSQNHGFNVEEESLPGSCHIWFRNANDGTVEGIAHKTLPLMAAQFHPEAAPGPRDSIWIFKRFLERI